MRIVEITFSPTGGTKKVSRAICEGLLLSSALHDATIEDVDMTKRDFSGITLCSDDIAVIALPSYSGRVPATAAERLSQVVGDGANAIIVTVYGNREFEDSLIETYDICKQQQFNIIAGVSAIAQHSIDPKIATHRPDDTDCSVLRDYGTKIADNISSHTDLHIPGNRPYRDVGGKMIVPKTSSDCNQCMSCASLCPVGAIDTSDAKTIDSNICISCMRCVSICPKGAKHIPCIMRFAIHKMLKAKCKEYKKPMLYM